LLEESMRDALTGIGNRRFADRALATLGPGDGLAMIDLDHFKKVNDKYGHAVGDRVLTFLKRSEEHTSELQSLMRISHAVFCLQKTHINNIRHTLITHTI